MSKLEDKGAGTGQGQRSQRARRPPDRRRLLAALALVCGVLAVVLAILAFVPQGSAPVTASYLEFRQCLARGQVQTATIAADHVDYTLADDPAVYRTDNPDTPEFKEVLLMAGVQVSDAPSADDVVNTVLNYATILLFLGIAVFVVERLVHLTGGTFKVVRKTGVTFDDVAGMEGLKQELRVLVDVLRDPKAYAAKGVRPVKGVILEGPPGNGKTLFARALATEAGVNFIATKGADFQSAFMSLGARKIRTLFSKARRHTPCIVFIDEFDSIGERRNYAGTGIDKENNRIITAMLNEMDGFTGREGVLVVAATNSYRSLDPALVRPGRFDLKFRVDNPDTGTREKLIDLYTLRAGRALDPGLSASTLADAFDGASCAAIETVLNGAASIALSRAGQAGESKPVLTLEDVRLAALKADVRLKG